jgi:hypothetical protein
MGGYIIYCVVTWAVCRVVVVPTEPLQLEGSKKLTDDGRIMPKHVGASI